jgi:hypothetical protein
VCDRKRLSYRATSSPRSETTKRLLWGRFGGVSGWIDPNAVHSLSSPASAAVDSASSRRTSQAARLQSARANSPSGPAAITCLLG